MEPKKLVRNMEKKTICGVCAGLADYLNVDVTVVRLIMVILAFFSGSGIILYIIAAFLIPEGDRY